VQSGDKSMSRETSIILKIRYLRAIQPDGSEIAVAGMQISFIKLQFSGDGNGKLNPQG
jgi:hypothetical protein